MQSTLVGKRFHANLFFRIRPRFAEKLLRLDHTGQAGKIIMDPCDLQAMVAENPAYGFGLSASDLDKGPAMRRQNHGDPGRQRAVTAKPVGPARKRQSGLEQGDLGLQGGEFAFGHLGRVGDHKIESAGNVPAPVGVPEPDPAAQSQPMGVFPGHGQRRV